MMNIAVRFTRLVLLLVIVVLCNTGTIGGRHLTTNEQSDFGLTGTDGRPDTEFEGEAAARIDIARNNRRYMTYGLTASLINVVDMGEYNIEFTNGGCVMGDYGADFWRGYNKTIRLEAQLWLGINSSTFRRYFGGNYGL